MSREPAQVPWHPWAPSCTRIVLIPLQKRCKRKRETHCQITVRMHLSFNAGKHSNRHKIWSMKDKEESSYNHVKKKVYFRQRKWLVQRIYTWNKLSEKKHNVSGASGKDESKQRGGYRAETASHCWALVRWGAWRYSKCSNLGVTFPRLTSLCFLFVEPGRSSETRELQNSR